MYRSLLISMCSIATALVLGCSDSSNVTAPTTNKPAFAPAQTGTEVFEFEVEFTDFLLCTEELVHWTGTVRIVDHFTRNRGFDDPNPELFQHQVHIETVEFNGVGETTGGTYRFLSHFNVSNQSPSPVNPNPTSVTVRATDRMFGPGGGILGIGHLSIKLVITGNGELLIDEVEFTPQCR